MEHSTGGKTELQSLLEACTGELMKIPRYKSDQRYLRLWIQYVSEGGWMQIELCLVLSLCPTSAYCTSDSTK